MIYGDIEESLNLVCMQIHDQKITDGVYFDLYKNPRALSGGDLVDEGVKDSHLEGDNPLEIQNKLLDKMGCGPLYTVENVNAPSVRSGESGSLFEINLKGGEHGYLFFSVMKRRRVSLCWKRSPAKFPLC